MVGWVQLTMNEAHILDEAVPRLKEISHRINFHGARHQIGLAFHSQLPILQDRLTTQVLLLAERVERVSEWVSEWASEWSSEGLCCVAFITSCKQQRDARDLSYLGPPLSSGSETQETDHKHTMPYKDTMPTWQWMFDMASCRDTVGHTKPIITQWKSTATAAKMTSLRIGK